MSTLHTFGCSITQGFALSDTIQPQLDSKGEPLQPHEVQHEIDSGTIKWEDIHILKPSQLAWPQLLGNRLNLPVINHARRGACFQQIARQTVTTQIEPTDVVIVMWTYLQRVSLQWPSRTAVPYCNIVDPLNGWRSVRLGINRWFGLSEGTNSEEDREIQQHIERTAQEQITPMGQFNHMYNNMVLQSISDGYLRHTGARVIHLSVEPESAPRQLMEIRDQLPATLRAEWCIPNPKEWYTVTVDHSVCDVILDPTIPTAPNDMHPSEQHHSNFADAVYTKYFE